MKLTRIIPLGSLAIVATVLAIGALHDAPLGMEFTAPPQNADLLDVDLGLGDLVLRGQLVDDQGQGVPDAGITTEQAGRPIWTWTGQDGSFELTDLRPGPLILRVVALGFEASLLPLSLEESTPPGELQTFTLDRRISAPPEPPPLELGDLSGRVQFGPLATPELGYELLFQPTTAPTDPDGGFPRRAQVAPDGRFHVDLLHAGPYRVILLSPDDRGATGPDLLQSSSGDTRTITHEISGDTPSLSLVATMGAVAGRVVSAKAPEEGTVPESPAEPPTAIRGALIRIERLNDQDPTPEDETATDRGTFRATRSEKDGQFELRDLPPGRYRMSFVAGRERRTMDLTIPTREVVTIDVHLAD